MQRRLVIISFLCMIFPVLASGQVNIRLFASSDQRLAVFSVNTGKYEMDIFGEGSFEITPGENIIISEFNDRLLIKARNREAIVCDSVFLSGRTGEDSFSLRVNGIRQYYSGDLHCYGDLGSLVLINLCDIESYIAGVVRAEGGSGKNIEYCKTQAVIARTYMYKYFKKHVTDRFNLCDNTHCQVFNGTSNDTMIIRAALETKGQVILTPDSTLITAAFHSNCGGETSPSEYVWLTSQPYLRKVTDPFCTGSRNAKWQATMSLEEWRNYLEKMGYKGDESNPAVLNFSQKARQTDFKAGSFSIPLYQMRADLKLRSTFFSFTATGDSLVFNGRGYGHGVGLCQEGAMMMALKGFDYRQIINFYYSGVVIADIRDAVIEEE
jgi:stage II sporulation protein D